MPRVLLLGSLLLTLAGATAAAAQAPTAGATAPDARALARVARTAAFHYESLQRRLAPTTNRGGRRADQCDERIGRFCLWYDSPDSPDRPPPPEPPEVADARTVAVRAHRRWFSAEPAHAEAAGFLVRYLVESGRAGEAVAAARTHAWAAKRSPDALLMLGLALHYAEEFVQAEAVFDTARAGMEEERRRRLDDVGALVEPRERGRYRDLDAAARARYEERFWRLSDPSALQPGNERRSAHYARHGWIAIYRDSPRVRGEIAWGSDHEEILLRWGIPIGRERINDFQPMLLSADPRFIESFDPASVSLVPAAMATRGLRPAPPPGTRHEIARDTARSMYAAVRLRIRPLEHVATLAPDGFGATLRVDAVLPADTIAPIVPIDPRAVLALLDTMGSEVLREPASVRAGPDSATLLTATLSVPPGAWVYRIELLDDSTGITGLAQYPIRVEDGAGFTLADLVVARPFGDSLPAAYDDPLLHPHPSLVLPTGSRVGLFSQARGLRRETRYSVEWSVEPAEGPSLLGRAARWLGERLGISEPEEPLSIRWEDVARGGTAPIAVTMDLSAAEAGLYRITLRLTNGLTGETRSSERLLRLEVPSPSPAR